MNETVNLIEFIRILSKRWKTILLITLIAPLISGVITYFVLTPIYQGTTQILVNQKNSENQIDLSQLRDNVELINTYRVIIKSPAILGKVIEKLDLSQNVEQLNQRITINSQDNSQVFSLTVEDTNPSRAVEIANSVSETFQQEIQEIMNVNNVSILAEAEYKENSSPIKPNLLFNLAIAVVIGFMTGIGTALLLQLFDNTLKDEQAVMSHLGLPVLGSIQKISENNNAKDIPLQKIGGDTLESYAKK